MLKKKDIFFDTLNEISNNLQEAVSYFAKGMKEENSLEAFAIRMKEYEKRGDQFTHTIIIALNKTFITPIEREDIMALTSSLDDVLDGIEACASRLEIYQIDPNDAFILKFMENLIQSAKQLHVAIHLLTTKKLLQIREHTIQINQLENQADDLLRAGLKALFANVGDPIELIKKKEIYELLEEATDACEDVANTLESIIMRNS